MTYEFKNRIFSGPLELLLELIENQEKEITDVSIAEVTEDFLKYIETAGNIRPEELADFLVIAAKLLLLKSRAILPSQLPDDESLSLESQLKLYKEFVEASRFIDKAWRENKVAYPRFENPIVSGVFYPPSNASTDKLRNIFEQILGRLEWIKKLPEQALERVVSIKEKIEALREFFKEQSRMTFGHIVKAAKSKTEIIVTFLALLELVKQREVALKQDVLFSEIHIKSS